MSDSEYVQLLLGCLLVFDNTFGFYLTPIALRKPRAKRKVLYLNIEPDYAPDWTPSDGIRELIQNWHDGILQTFDMHAERLAQSIVEEDLTKKSKGICFLAHESKTLPKERKRENAFGLIEWNPDRRELKLFNRDVVLPLEVLKIGKTNKLEKKADLGLIGGFGEGMKVTRISFIHDGSESSCAGRHKRNYTGRFDSQRRVRTSGFETRS